MSTLDRESREPDEAEVELVARAMERLDAGEVPDFDALCAERPDLREAVEKSCAYAARVGLGLSSPTTAGAGQEDPAPSRNPRILGGRYRLDEELGAGAMGIVYRALDLELGRSVAVKLLRPLLFDGAEARLRFEREAEALATLNHPAVVTVHDRGFTADGAGFLVMELLDGLPLSAVVEAAEERGATVFTESTGWLAEQIGAAAVPDRTWIRSCVSWAMEVVQGLAATHAASLVHRDVKPSNVFLCSNGRVVLLDFGIAADLRTEAITQDGSSPGTPAYMAPEVPGGERPTAAVDVYGAAATLYHLLTLRAPFHGSPSQVLQQLMRQDPEPAHRVHRGLPRDLRAILDRGMERDPARRYRSAADFAADLQRFLEHRPVRARPIGPLDRLRRRLARSTAAKSVLATVALVAIVFGGHRIRLDWLEGRRQEWLATIVGIPPNLTLATQTNRRVTSPEESAAVRALLDRAVSVEDGSSWSLLVRAMFRFDQGERQRAVADLSEAARRQDSEYLRQVARAVERAPADASDASKVSLIDLPEPASAEDRLVAAYLALRVADFETAESVLGDAMFDTLPGAILLRAFCAVARCESAATSVARRDAADEILQGITRFESQVGPTAWSRHMAGFAWRILERDDRALEAAQQALRMSRFAYGAAINAGDCARRLGRYDEALEALHAAQRMRPGFYKPFLTEVRTLIDAGELDAAERLLPTAPLGEGRRGAWQRLLLGAAIDSERAYAQWRAGQHEAAAEDARRAVEAFEQAARMGRIRDVTRLAVARALASGEPARAFQRLLELEAGRPFDGRRLAALIEVMPEALNQDETAAIRSFLRSVVDWWSTVANAAPDSISPR